ncbi:MAG: pilus assembly protein [Firmicutes bacterium]|nr:pilus assembly protein [Bacillota bacterium]
MNKLNKKGQTLIMFVILIPLLIMMLALVVDVSYMTNEKIKLDSTTKTIIKEMFDNRFDNDMEDKIYNLYKKNKINYENVKIDKKEEYLKIKNYYEIDSIFGKIIGLKKYKIKTSIKGYKEKNKIKVIKE